MPCLLSPPFLSTAWLAALPPPSAGRSLGQFVELMKKCDGKVAVPDVVITAVGTKVCMWGGRGAEWGRMGAGELLEQFQRGSSN